jgi:hypothetical protein
VILEYFFSSITVIEKSPYSLSNKIKYYDNRPRRLTSSNLMIYLFNIVEWCISLCIILKKRSTYMWLDEDLSTNKESVIFIIQLIIYIYASSPSCWLMKYSNYHHQNLINNKVLICLSGWEENGLLSQHFIISFGSWTICQKILKWISVESFNFPWLFPNDTLVDNVISIRFDNASGT